MDCAVIGTTRVTGVFGYPVEHSQSPAMQNAAFREMGMDFVYVPFSVSPDDLESAIRGVRALGMVGVNLTIPHKERVIEHLDWVSEDATKIRSVNTVHNHDGVLKGYSTDGPGLVRALESSGKSPSGSRAVVIGAGGSARATAYALVKAGADVTVANRTESRAVELADQLRPILGQAAPRAIGLESSYAAEAVREADLLVNCTPVGMHPKMDEQPVPSEWLHDGLFVYDQIYNPLETRLLSAAKAAGAKVANGVKMLVFQGALSFEIWTGKEPPVRVMEASVINAMQARR